MIDFFLFSYRDNQTSGALTTPSEPIDSFHEHNLGFFWKHSLTFMKKLNLIELDN